jgi:hypothetical protein
VILDEEDPEPEENQQAQPEQDDEPPVEQKPLVKDTTLQVQPTQQASQQPQEPVQPVQSSVPETNGLEQKIDQQIQKNDEVLMKFDELQNKLNLTDIMAKLNTVEKELEDLKNPPFDDQLEMISKSAYPYNVKLSDFYGWDDDDEEEPKDVVFKINPEEIKNYNKEEIKNSFK